MAVFAASLGFSGAMCAAEPMNLDALLKTLEQGKSAQSEQNKQREQEFAARQNEQVQMLKNTQAKRNQMLSESERLETQFEENEIKLANLTDTLSKRMGSLKSYLVCYNKLLEILATSLQPRWYRLSYLGVVLLWTNWRKNGFYLKACVY